MAGQKPIKVFDPISDSIHSALHQRVEEYSTMKRVTVFAGTWNLCGKPISGLLETWLFPDGECGAFYWIRRGRGLILGGDGGIGKPTYV